MEVNLSASTCLSFCPLCLGTCFTESRDFLGLITESRCARCHGKGIGSFIEIPAPESETSNASALESAIRKAERLAIKEIRR